MAIGDGAEAPQGVMGVCWWELGLPFASAPQCGISMGCERVNAQKGEQGWGRVCMGLDSCPALYLPVMAAAASEEMGEGVVREM